MHIFLPQVIAQEEKKRKKRDSNQPSSREQLKLMQNRMHSLETEIGGLGEMLKQVLVKKQVKSGNKTSATSSSSDDEKSLHSD